MQVIHWGRARQFFQTDEKAEDALERWRIAVLASQWKDFQDLLATFDTARYADGKVTFDLKADAIRLTAVADYKNDKLYIRQISNY